MNPCSTSRPLGARHVTRGTFRLLPMAVVSLVSSITLWTYCDLSCGTPEQLRAGSYCFPYGDVIMMSWTRLVARHPRIPILGLLITSSRCIRVRTLVQDSYCALKPVDTCIKALVRRPEIAILVFFNH